MTLSGFLAHSGALALAAAIPGPGVTALLARALRIPRWLLKTPRAQGA